MALALLGFSGPALAPASASAAGTPTITSISPSSGPTPGGTSFTITGTNLAGDEPATTLIGFRDRDLARSVSCTKTSCTGTGRVSRHGRGPGERGGTASRER
nr:IPT/TIG domain-containing protein [Streptomyces sp. NBC_00974]